MPVLRVRRLQKTLSLPAGGTYTLGEFVPAKRAGAVAGKGYRAIGCSVRVITAANGTGTLSIGVTGNATALMATTDVALGTAGRKTSATGAYLAGNGTAVAPGASEVDFIATYTRGTDTNTPVVRVCILYVEDPSWTALEVT